VHALLLTYKASTLVPDAEKWLVPGIYTVIMAVDALIAIPAGLGYDRQGLRFLLLPFALSFLPSILVVWAGHFAMIAVAAILVGVILGAQESVYRAAVADLAPLASRGWAYGISILFMGWACWPVAPFLAISSTMKVSFWLCLIPWSCKPSPSSCFGRVADKKPERANQCKWYENCRSMVVCPVEQVHQCLLCKQKRTKSD